MHFAGAAPMALSRASSGSPTTGMVSLNHSSYPYVGSMQFGTAPAALSRTSSGSPTAGRLLSSSPDATSTVSNTGRRVATLFQAYDSPFFPPRSSRLPSGHGN